ncbi:MAG: V-type ATP synthase subunit D [Clostridiales bacterium]|nr:V-type ATP synthase subunit D [Clostridiales bacterium]
MAVMRVNPTRMELTRLKKRLAIAVRGHKLLKDKRDEMIRRFIELVRRNKELREQVEKELNQALGDFLMARAVMSTEVLEEAVMYPTRQVELKISKQNVMSVDVPKIDYEEKSQEGLSPYPYGFASTSGELDGAIATLSDILPRMLELAEIEKTCQMLADEIEKTRRRVNALEHIMIPQMEDTIKYITMKMDENERASRTRLMKVKDMIEERNIESSG